MIGAYVLHVDRVGQVSDFDAEDMPRRSWQVPMNDQRTHLDLQNLPALKVQNRESLLLLRS